MRNTFLALLRWKLGQDLFDATVRVEGSRGLDCSLAKHRTLDGLVSKRMEQDLLLQEVRVMALNTAISSAETVLFELFPQLTARYGSLPSDVTDIIVKCLDLADTISKLHFAVAEARFQLERAARDAHQGVHVMYIYIYIHSIGAYIFWCF